MRLKTPCTVCTVHPGCLEKLYRAHATSRGRVFLHLLVDESKQLDGRVGAGLRGQGLSRISVERASGAPLEGLQEHGGDVQAASSKVEFALPPLRCAPLVVASIVTSAGVGAVAAVREGVGEASMRSRESRSAANSLQRRKIPAASSIVTKAPLLGGGGRWWW